MKKAATVLVLAALAASAQSILTMRRAPGFSLPDTRFKQHDLADYRGKVVVLDVMKTDCPGCLALTKTLEQLKAKYGDKIQVLSVVTLPDNMDTVKKYIAANKVTSPVLFDCGQVIGSYMGISPANPKPVHMPYVYVIDRNGMIRADLPPDKATAPGIAAVVDSVLK
jgi:peroxiredoxin